jgi:2-polyprenyl-3-methyl-5-hydroxy-6-metoxy-1,4-benzoquinol methylase
MDTYKQTFKTWNKVAQLYQDKFMELDLYNSSYDFVCETITQTNAKLLDVGCGPGNITKYLLSKRPDYIIRGIDIAPAMIKLAKENNPSAHFSVMDSRKVNELTESYDGIICGFCLPYLSTDDCIKFINDCYQLLNNNGLLYISFVEGDAAKSGFQTGGSGDSVYFYYHNKTLLAQLLLECKFDLIKTDNVRYQKSPTSSEMHTIVFAKKGY